MVKELEDQDERLILVAVQLTKFLAYLGSITVKPATYPRRPA
jgi:hypothetical protein